MILSSVGRLSFISWRLAPSIAKPIGTPCPSVSRLRFTPLLPRSVGLGPVFFPAQRRFGHRPVHREPLPVNPMQLIKLLDSRLPQLEEDSGFDPLLKAIMGRRMRTQFGVIQRLPLAARSQHVENGINTVTIGHPWPSSRHPRWVFTCTGSSGCNCAHNSSEMRKPVVVPLLGVRSRSRFLGSCLFIAPILSHSGVIRIGP